MHALVERVRAFRRSPHFKRTLKFATVSVITTIVSQTVLFVTFDVVSLASAMECSAIATAVATIPAYWLNRTWTWEKRGRSSFWSEVLPFWLIAFIGLVLSTVAVGLAAHHADIISHKKDVKGVVVQAAYLLTYALIWVGRYTIFNRYLFGTRPERQDQRQDVIDTEAVECPPVTAAPLEASR
ncbi:MAG: GtrA family protein [Acidimicrobiales bacterium]